MQKDKSFYRLLIAEDNDGDYILVTDYLDEVFLENAVLRFRTYEELKEHLSTPSLHADVLLLDLSLPDKKGEELISSVLEIAAEMPIIVLTGHADVSFAIRSLALGASDYLLKDDLTPVILHKSIVYSIERNKNLVKIRESEQRYAELFQLSPQPMWVYDLETLAFLDVNEAAVNHYGYSYEEFLAMTIRDIRPPEDIPYLESLVAQSRAVDSLFFQGVFTHKKKNGELITVDIRSNIIYFNGRKAEIILANDVTERINHITAIEQQNERLKEIAWTQSHIVRAPLARMMGLIQLIKDPGVSLEEKTAMLGYMTDSAEELDTIIRDIVAKSQQILPPK